MKKTICLTSILTGILFLAPPSFAEKRDTFSYEDKSGSHTIKDEWFGSQKKRRKELEAANEKKQREALKAEAEKRKALQKKKKEEEDAKTKTSMAMERIQQDKKNPSPNPTGLNLGQEKESLRNSLRTRAGNYPTRKAPKSTPKPK